MENEITMEDFITEQAAVILDSAKDEIVADYVFSRLTEGKDVTASAFDYITAVTEQAILEMSEMILPDAEDLVITESDYVITESGDLYFVDGDDVELIAESVIVANEDVMVEGEEAEGTGDVEGTEGDQPEEGQTEEVITEGEETLEDSDAIVAAVIARIQSES